MSLLVMGVGVTSVATLFPLAVFRGARATALTAGTILKENAEETVRFSRSPSLEAPLPSRIGGLPTSSVGSFPKGTSPGVDGQAMLLDPDANGTVDVCGAEARVTFGQTLAWGPPGGLYQGNGGTPRKYLVDPLGAAALAADGDPKTSPWFFGANASATTAGTDQFGTNLAGTPTLRFAWPYPYEILAAADGGNAAVKQQMLESAYNIVGRAGDYGTDIDANATVTYRTGTPDYLELTFDSRDATDGSLEEFFPQAGTAAAAPGADLARAVLFTPDQQNSAAIPLTRLRSQAAIDVVPANGRSILLALPQPNFLAAAGLSTDGDVAALRVRLERPDRRYSWMLTCKRTGSAAPQARVAVFFNRALSADDEQIWQCLPAGNGSYVLFWTPGSGLQNPLVKSGGWLLEMGDLNWLQVGRVLEEEGDPAAGSAPTYVTRLFNAAGSPTGAKYLEFTLSSQTPRLDAAGPGRSLYATFPRGVVSVYTLDP